MSIIYSKDHVIYLDIFRCIDGYRLKGKFQSNQLKYYNKKEMYEISFTNSIISGTFVHFRRLDDLSKDYNGFEVYSREIICKNRVFYKFTPSIIKNPYGNPVECFDDDVEINYQYKMMILCLNLVGIIIAITIVIRLY